MDQFSRIDSMSSLCYLVGQLREIVYYLRSAQRIRRPMEVCTFRFCLELVQIWAPDLVDGT
jgi:hypothetical protein